MKEGGRKVEEKNQQQDGGSLSADTHITHTLFCCTSMHTAFPRQTGQKRKRVFCMENHTTNWSYRGWSREPLVPGISVE